MAEEQEREDLISPMLLAKEMDIQPQRLYGLMRNQTVKEHLVLGKKYISRKEVADFFAGSRKTGAKSDLEKVGSKGVKVGSIFQWTIKTRTAIITEVNEDIIYGDDTSDSGEAIFLPKNVPDLLKEGKVVIESPEKVLRMVCTHFLSEGGTLGKELESFLTERGL